LERKQKKIIAEDGGHAVFCLCDATKTQDLANLFDTAKKRFGKIDIVCNNAGISVEKYGQFFDSLSPQAWKKMVDVNFTAVTEGTLMAIEAMLNTGGGVIINTASLAGLFPQANTPIYAATKSGVVHLTRSMEHLDNLHNIRVVAICPSFASTPIIGGVEDHISATFGRIMTVDEVVQGFVELVLDTESRGGGAVLSVTASRGLQYPPRWNKTPAKL